MNADENSLTVSFEPTKSLELQYELAVEELKARYSEIELLNGQFQASNSLAVTLLAGVSGIFAARLASDFSLIKTVSNVEFRLLLCLLALIFLAFLLMKQLTIGRIGRQALYIEEILRPQLAKMLGVPLTSILKYEKFIAEKRTIFLDNNQFVGRVLYDNLLFSLPYGTLLGLALYGASLAGARSEGTFYVLMLAFGGWRLLLLSNVWRGFDPTAKPNRSTSAL